MPSNLGEVSGGPLAQGLRLCPSGAFGLDLAQLFLQAQFLNLQPGYLHVHIFLGNLLFAGLSDDPLPLYAQLVELLLQPLHFGPEIGLFHLQDTLPLGNGLL